MKRVFFAGIVVTFLVLLSAGAYLEHQEMTAGYAGVELQNNEAIVARLREGLKRKAPSITVTFSSHVRDIGEPHALAKELLEKALAETDDPTEGDYLRYQYGGYTVRYGRTADGLRYRHTLKITPDYYTTPEEEAAVDAEAARILASFSFTEETPDEEKVRVIHDYLCETVSFDRVHQNNAYQHGKTTAYSALCLHSAVCQGYAVAAYRLLRESGVNARVVTGLGMDPETEASERHAWNLVELNGAWYNLDVTWDDVLATDEYYLKDDPGFRNHQRDPENE